jgi:tetratricopeptide (TPR) repeat protein/peroxiredoxin
MRHFLKLFSVVLLSMTTIMLGADFSHGQIRSGQTASTFSLEDVNGKRHNLAEIKAQPMIILYFFDVESRPSQEGLFSLDQLAKQYEDANLLVWAITRSPKQKVSAFIAQTKTSSPILLDTSNVSDLYQARVILPTVCILGPNFKILDHIQGGGKSTEIMLLRLAERNLQRKQYRVAEAISATVEEQNPQNLDAKVVKGYAALKEGKEEEAEITFRKMSQKTGREEILGKEGLTAVYAQTGQTEKALELADEVEKKAPDRAYVHVIKGDLLHAKNRKMEAKAEYQKAVTKKLAKPFQKAVALNKYGRVQANEGNHQKARELFDKAVEIDPYYIEATSNKGMSYEKEEKWDKALDSYRQALALDKNDTFAAVLSKRAQERLLLQNDAEKKKRIDKLVKELAERYRGQKEAGLKVEDTWTSRPMVLSFVDFQEKGILAERDGFATVVTSQLLDQINDSGRAQVVERILVERLLEELNLGSSELANPETALRLGQVLAAKIIGTGSFYHLPDGTLLSLRLIDTETSAIPKVVTRQIKTGASLEKEIHRLNREIIKTIITKYPLRGYVVETGKRIMINLGSKQGVVLGTKFDILKDQEPIKYKGKELRRSPKSIAQIEVDQVEQDLCYAHVLSGQDVIQPDDKIQEKMVELK